jgi:hypothetical protein
MKLSILLGVLLIALLTVPATVSAGTTTAFSGTIPSGTTIMVSPSTIDLGTISPPYTYDGLGVSVNTSTYDTLNWVLKAEDTTPGSTSKGYMYSASPVRSLTNPFEIYDYTLSTPAYQPIGTSTYTWYTGVGTGWTNVSAFFHQEVTRNDLSGAYSMIVTFTWVSA